MSKEEIIAKVKYLYAESKSEIYKDGEYTYEWELGRFVVDVLLLENKLFVNYRELIKPLYFGYPIRINHINPWCIKLWREVKA